MGGSSAAAATVGAGNRLTAFKGYTLTYDANGNVLTKWKAGADSFAYTWDALSRLKEVRNHGTLVVTFAYDALGRRASKITVAATERYVYDGDAVIQDLDGSNQIKLSYAYGPEGVFALGTPSSWVGNVITDPVIGSVRAIVSASTGAVQKAYWVAPWGDTYADTGLVTRFRMGGQEYDQETGLYYLRARYYDPQTGRFIAEDPIGIDGGLNLYSYAGNDPINGRDPSGLCHEGVPHPPGPPPEVEEVCVYARYPASYPRESSPWGDSCYGDHDCPNPPPDADPPRSRPPRDLGQFGMTCGEARASFYLSVVTDGLTVVGGLGLIAKGAKALSWGVKFVRYAEAGEAASRVLNAHRQYRYARAGAALAGSVYLAGEAYGADTDVWAAAAAQEAPSWKDFVPIWGSFRAHAAMKRACEQ